MPTIFDANPKTAKNRANKKHKKAKLKDLTATLEIEGDPTIIAGDKIVMKGVAAKHEGDWYVIKVSHHISKGGYKTTLELNKNATNLPASLQSTQINALDNGSLNTATETAKNQRQQKDDGTKIPRYNANGNKI